VKHDAAPLPHDARAERIALSGLLREPGLNRRAFALLAPADFHEYPHRILYAAVYDLWVDFAREVSLPAVYEELRARGQLAELGINPALYLADLFDADPTGFGCRRAAGRVRKLAKRARRIVAARETLGRLLKVTT
jgi:replicative DNA helicase